MWIETIGRVEDFVTWMSIKILVDMVSLGRTWPLPHGVTVWQGLQDMLDIRLCFASVLHPLLTNLLEIKQRRIDLGVYTLLGHM
jgi:hypothetical protein